MDKVTLDKLPIDTLGKVLHINCDEGIKRRLLDLGIIKGTIIKPVLRSPFRRFTCIRSSSVR
jgi:Fe2+ transport system protein FeoA